MPNSSKLSRISLVALGASWLVGLLVGGVVYLVLVAFSWWAQLPHEEYRHWVGLTSFGVGVLIWFYTLWMFVSGESSPREMWERVKEYFDDGGD